MLKFSEAFNQPIDSINLPDTIEYIQFGDCFNQPINTTFLPQSLRGIMFGFGFNQSFENVRWPSGLKTIILAFIDDNIARHLPDTIELIETAFISSRLVKLPNLLKKLLYSHDDHNYLKQSYIPSKCEIICMQQ